ncbi:MAG TPA: 4Fe-4S dicluster domain-containing protein [Bryobacteraceae bacterium]|nr:4Fe-4S dicluster domain-containing protein [Bryobacteraceae bacterium]
MARYAMVIDLELCLGCAACVTACQVKNELGPRRSRARVAEVASRKGARLHLNFYSERCNHCADAPCVRNCPTGASHYAEAGLVSINRSRCTGCQACIAACPYSARYISAEGYADKCDFCGGREPACVANCPSSAMYFGDLDSPASEVARLLKTRKSRVPRPESGTRPHVFYLTSRKQERA